jgi:hypothetical protein
MHISHNMREIMNGIGEARGLSLGPEMNELGAKNMVHLKDQVEEIRRRGEAK